MTFITYLTAFLCCLGHFVTMPASGTIKIEISFKSIPPPEMELYRQHLRL